MRSDPIYADTQYSKMLLVLGAFIVIGTGIAVGAVFGDVVRTVVWALGLAVLGYLLRATRIRVSIDENGVHAGAAHVEWRYVERVESLNEDGMRRALSIEGHPSDFRRVRGTRHGIRLWLADSTDPHRAWLVSVSDGVRAASALRAFGGGRCV